MASILLYLQGCQSCLYMASQSGGICLYSTPQLDLGGYKHGWLISDEICLRYRREKNLQPSKTASPKCAKIARLGRFVLMRCAILPSQMVLAPVTITLKKYTKNKEDEMKDYLFKILKPRKKMTINRFRNY